MTDNFDMAKEYERLFRDAQNRTEQKQKMRKLMAKYGENEFDIENNTTPAEHMEYILAGGREMLEMVQKENMIKRMSSTTPQTPMPTTAQDSPDYTISSETSLREKEILDNRDYWKKRQDLFKRAKTHLSAESGEGLVENIYLDTKGHITIGAGKMVDDKKTFMALNLRNGNREATDAEKQEAYDKFQELIQKKEYGQTYNAYHYKAYSPLRITSQTIDDLLDVHLLNDIARLSKGMPEFDSLPIELQEVLVDIRYNTGAVTEKGWPKLRRAIRDKNLSQIINEIERGDVPKERNNWAKEKIKSITGWGYWEK